MFLLLLVYEHLIGVQDHGERSTGKEKVALFQEDCLFILRKQLHIGLFR